MSGQVEFHIRPALSFEWQICLSLLPELLISNSLPQNIFIALSKSNPSEVLGVGALIPELKDTLKPGFPIMIRTLEKYRRQGVGRKLVQKLASHAAEWDVPHIHAWQAYPQGEEASFLVACGFSPYLNYFGFEVPRESAKAILAILERYTQRSRSHDSYEFKPLVLKTHSDVVRLYSQHFLVTYEIAYQRLQQSLLRPAANTLSAMLYLDNVLQGYIIGYEDHESVPKVDFWITERELSHTPAAMLLLCYFVKQAYDFGYARARFDCNDQARSTIKVAQRLNAKQIFHAQSYARPTNDIQA